MEAELSLRDEPFLAFPSLPQPPWPVGGGGGPPSASVEYSNARWPIALEIYFHF